MLDRVLLFDLDGTLYPSSIGTEREIIPALLAEVGIELGLSQPETKKLTHRLSRQYGYSVRGLIVEGLTRNPEDLVERIYSRIDKSRIAHNDVLSCALADRSEDSIIAVLTNSSRGHAENVLQRLGVRDHINHVFGIQDVDYKLKPDSSVYLTVAAELGVDPRQFVYFDDSIRNLHAAWKMGSRCILVSNSLAEFPYFWENHLRIRHYPPEHIESTFDLPGFLQEDAEVCVVGAMQGRGIAGPKEPAPAEPSITGSSALETYPSPVHGGGGVTKEPVE